MEEVRVERTTYIVIDDEKDAAPDTTASAKMDIAATRERISDTIADIEQRMSDKVASAKAKVDVVGLIRENPWPALVIGFAAGLALSATGADRKAAHATADAAKRGAASAARATAAGVSQLASAAVEKVKGSPGDDATETAEPSGLMAKAKGAIRELGDEIRRGADELSAAARRTKNAGL
jgi:ElaB/YqjD/DUF883 family membrane-anchored ribosome-binding protein